MIPMKPCCCDGGKIRKFNKKGQMYYETCTLCHGSGLAQMPLSSGLTIYDEPKEVEIRQYEILNKIATRLAQYELPGEYISKENREKLFKQYHLLYDEIVKFYDRIDKTYPEPTVK